MLSHSCSHGGVSNIFPSIHVDVPFALHQEYAANGSPEDCHIVSASKKMPFVAGGGETDIVAKLM